MKKSTKKKQKYKTRLERNKNNYKNSSSTYSNKKVTPKKIIISVLAVSIFFNACFLLQINNLYSSIDDLDSTIEENKKNYDKEISKLQSQYANYLFLGDSITYYYDLNSYYKDLPVINSGISGDTTEDILNDLTNRAYVYNPSKVFLLIGTNDLNDDIGVDEVVSNIKAIITDINKNEPQAEIYVESIYPVNYNTNRRMVGSRNNEDIMKINNSIKEYCNNNSYTYIDIYDLLSDEDGNLKEEYSGDGLHLNGDGYNVVTDALKKYLD